MYVIFLLLIPIIFLLFIPIQTLLEAQFDMYKTFKDKVNLLSANELRLQPCGRDKKGVSYWCQLDDCANLRIYSDDQDEETWTLVARFVRFVLCCHRSCRFSFSASLFSVNLGQEEPYC